MNDTNSSAKKVALCGMFVALSMLFGYVELMIPFSIGIPGVKLGLANLVVIVALYRLDGGYVWAISLLRVALSGLLFSNISVMLYSLGGACVSLIVMQLMKKTDRFSRIGVSIGGGVFHNIGQLLVAYILVRNEYLFYYFPVLVFAGCVAGCLIGILAYIISKRITALTF